MTRDEPSKEDIEVFREALTMALYISLSLLAVLVALPTSVTSDSTTPVLTVALTALGLVLAHQLAFRLSTRLVSHGRVDALSLRLLGAQLAGGLFVVVLAVLPMILLGSGGLTWSLALLLAFVAGTGYLAARAVPLGRLRSLLYVVVVVIGVLAVLFIKGTVGH